MILTRRKLLTGLIAAPIVVTTPGLLMPVKAIEHAVVIPTISIEGLMRWHIEQAKFAMIERIRTELYTGSPLKQGLSL